MAFEYWYFSDAEKEIRSQPTPCQIRRSLTDRLRLTHQRPQPKLHRLRVLPVPPKKQNLSRSLPPARQTRQQLHPTNSNKNHHRQLQHEQVLVRSLLGVPPRWYQSRGKSSQPTNRKRLKSVAWKLSEDARTDEKGITRYDGQSFCRKLTHHSRLVITSKQNRIPWVQWRL